MFVSSDKKTVKAKPKHVDWVPHSYQRKGVDFLTGQGAAALFADPGTGKTSTTLSAFEALRSRGLATKMLVIAPRRVCQLVWWQESQQWSQFRHLRFAWLHNSRAPWDVHGSLKNKDKEAARDDADIYLINPEGVPWLFKKFGSKMPFDIVTVDELTKFKNARAKRSKMLLKFLQSAKRVWGLTGSPTPNGYEDLFGQMLILDGGNALGRYYTHFRDKYFIPDGFGGFKYTLAPGADKRIEERIAPLVLRIAAADWLDLPQQRDNLIMIKLDAKARAAYDTLKKEMLLQVGEGVVTAANSAALYSKLAQLANGAVYLEQRHGQKREYVHVHDLKLDALEDLVEELSGAPLLVTYEFNHDLERLKARFGEDLPYLGKGTTDRQASDIERMWNNNELPLLAVQPASSGHGLNFQRGGAQHICHFSATWDYELYDQVIQRILRQGNTAEHVINHLLLVENSIDELKYAALRDKDTTQDSFLEAINTAFELETPVAGAVAAIAKKEIKPMAFNKLKKKTEVAQAAPEPEVVEEETPTAKPKGWSTKTAAPNADDDAELSQEDQKEAIKARLRGKERPAAKVDEEDTLEEADVSQGFTEDIVQAIAEESVRVDDNDHVLDNASYQPPTGLPVVMLQVGANMTEDGSTPRPYVMAQTQVGGNQVKEVLKLLSEEVVNTMKEMLGVEDEDAE